MARSKKKGPFTINLSNELKNKIPNLDRNLEITSQIVNTTCQVYNGRKFIKITATENMVGHKLGEFAPTREKFIFKKKKKK